MDELYKFIVQPSKQTRSQIVILVIAWLAFAPQFRAQTLLTESFNYPNGTALTVANWTNVAGAGTNNVTASTGNINYPGTIGNGIGNKVTLTNNGQDVTRSFTSTAVSTAVPMYVSMVVNVSDARTGDYFFTLGGVPIYIRTNGLGGFNFGVSKTTATVTSYETTARAFGQYLLVLKYEVAAGNTNDVVKLFVTPSLSSEPATASVSYTATGGSAGTDVTSFAGISLYQGTVLTSPTLEIDNINVGTTWAGVTSARYDYGDAPGSYDTSKDNIFIPAVHTPLMGLYLGSTAPDQELSPYSVSSGENNTTGDNSNGNADEDAVVQASSPIRKGALYTLSIPVNNPATVTRYLYGWIDFNNNGKFEAGEVATTSFSATGSSTQTLTWTSTQTNSISSATKLYMRLRLSTVSLNDVTSTGVTDYDKIDERSIGNGVLNTISFVDAPTYSTGEVEDYQIDVIDTFDFGDVPASYDNDKDGTAKPARNLPTNNLYLGSTYTVESAPLSVAAGADNNGINGDGISDDGLTSSQLNIRTNVVNNFVVNIKNITGSSATLYAWLDLNNNGRFESGEAATAVMVANNATTATISFTAAQVNTITAATSKVYLRLRLIQANPLSTIGDLTTGTNSTVVDEKAIADGTNTGAYLYASYGEIEDYQLTVTRDFGDVPASYENGSPASQTNDVTGNASFTMGTTIDYELTSANVTSLADNNGTNGDGADEDAVSIPQTITTGAPFSITIPVNNKTSSANTAYVYGWIDLNGDGIFNGNEVGTASTTPSIAANGTANITITWSNTAVNTSVLATGKTYVRFRLSDTSMINANNATQTLIDTRSYGTGNGDGEIEDYQFVVNNLYEYGDAPVSYDQPGGTLVAARQLANSTLKLGATVDIESAPQSVVGGTDNNGINGDGTDEDGIDPIANPITPGTAYTINVAVTNTTGSDKTLYGWVDFNNNGIFESTEAVTASVSNNATTATLTWPSTSTANAISSNAYIRLRMSSATLTDNGTTTTYDEKAIGDGLNTGAYGITPGIGEIEDYRVVVNPAYDYGDLPVSYDQPAGILVAARQLTSTTLRLGATVDIESAPQSVAAGTDNNGTNGDGTDEDGINPTTNPITPGTAYAINVTLTNTTGSTKTLYGWVDFNNNGIFENTEAVTASVANNATTATLTWPSTSTTNTIGSNAYIRLRMSSATLADNGTTTTYDERAIGDGLSMGTYGTAPGIGEIEDYRVSVNPAYDFGDVPVSYDQPAGNLVAARQLPSGTLRLGASVDTETGAQSVAAGTDNNGTNGDGTDEDGINPTTNPITPGVAYAINIAVTNTTGSSKILYGWVDFNNNGTFENTEVATASVVNNATTATLTWIEDATLGSNGSNAYIRLRMSSGTLADNAATTAYDERAIGDGLSTGAYGTTPQIGEIEDYRVVVNPVAYDYGDAPISFDMDKDGTVDPLNYKPARNVPTSSLYLGSTYTVESSPLSVLAGIDNNNFNGDGISDDGITSGQLIVKTNTVNSYNVIVKNTTGTAATLYAWIDFNNNGRFEATEVTTTNILSGATLAVLNFSTSQANALLSGSPTNVYMRLRLVKTNSLVTISDNTSGTNNLVIDERAIADGTSIGAYSSASVGEVEDYRLAVQPFVPVPISSYTVNPTISNINNVLQGEGITISGGNFLAGTACQRAIYTGGLAAGLGFDQGVFFGTGCTPNLLRNNTTVSNSDNIGTSYSDANLTSIASGATYDPIVYTFTVTLGNDSNNLNIDYQFGSEEFPNYVGSAYNDAFGFFVSGPGIMGTQNLGKLPTGSNVSVNTVNIGTNGCAGSGSIISTNQYYYINNGHTVPTSSCNTNPGPFPLAVEFNGMTNALSYSIGGLTPGGTYTFKIAIADTADPSYDSGVFISKIYSKLDINANNDNYGIVSAGSTTTVSVLDNDTYAASTATISNVTLTSYPPVGFTVNNNGTVTVDASVTPGVYSFDYNICSIITPSNCDTATIIIEVVSSSTSLCYKPAATSGTVQDTKHGITALGRAGADSDNWPMVRKGAWTALESKEKGFVINRIPTTAQVNSIANPIEGMMIYDEEADCLKVYTTKEGDATPAWHCMSTQACPD